MENIGFLKVAKELDNFIDDFLFNGIDLIYNDLSRKFNNYITMEVDEEKIKTEQLNFIEMYTSEQSSMARECLNIINSHKYENLSLYVKLDDVQKYFKERESAYLSIKNDTNNKFDEKKAIIGIMETSFNYYKMRTNNNIYEYKKSILKIMSNSSSEEVVKIFPHLKESVVFENLNAIYQLYEKLIIKIYSDIKKNIETEIKTLNLLDDIMVGFDQRFNEFAKKDIDVVKKISNYILKMENYAVASMSILNGIILKEVLNKRVFENILTYEEDSETINYSKFVQETDRMLKILEERILIASMENNIDKNLVNIANTLKFLQELKEVFNAVNLYIENIISNCSDDELKILLGINETIKIKIATISSSIDDFNDNIIGFIFKNNESNIKNYREKIINDIESDFKTYDYCEITTKKGFAKEVEKIRKEKILYELSSFEEIVNHSIKELRKSKSTVIIDFVKFIDFTILRIDKLLLKNKVDKIFPAQNSKFDSKEHFVLVAENDSNFRKGDIIKAVTTGYKVGNNVIIKANVIAAR